MSVSIPFFTPKQISNLPEITPDNLTEINIRPAKIGDVHGMSALINNYASRNVMLARGPLYLYQHLQDYIVATTNLKTTGQECVIACGALQILWADLAEIRSLAVHKCCHSHGLGRRVVESLINRCRELNVPRVFCFTLVDDFFRHCGFKEFKRDLLPPVVWTECSKCPKFYQCDEISMIYEVS